MDPAVTMNDTDLLRAFVRSVVIRARHHAENLDQIALVLTGAILWKKDPETEMKARLNILWVPINNVRYVFAYVQGNGGTIEMRHGSQQGPVLAKFTNEMTIAQVMAIFDGLKQDPTWEEFQAEMRG